MCCYRTTAQYRRMVAMTIEVTEEEMETYVY